MIVASHFLTGAILTLVLTQIMNAAFIVPLKHAGLALSIGLAACVNAGLLYRKLRQHDIYQPQPGWARFALKGATNVTLANGNAITLRFNGTLWREISRNF